MYSLWITSACFVIHFVSTFSFCLFCRVSTFSVPRPNTVLFFYRRFRFAGTLLRCSRCGRSPGYATSCKRSFRVRWQLLLLQWDRAPCVSVWMHALLAVRYRSAMNRPKFVADLLSCPISNRWGLLCACCVTESNTHHYFCGLFPLPSLCSWLFQDELGLKMIKPAELEVMRRQFVSLVCLMGLLCSLAFCSAISSSPLRSQCIVGIIFPFGFFVCYSCFSSSVVLSLSTNALSPHFLIPFSSFYSFFRLLSAALAPPLSSLLC